MTKAEMIKIMGDAICEHLVLNWSDSQRLTSGIEHGLKEIEKRRQEEGPEVIQMLAKKINPA